MLFISLLNIIKVPTLKTYKFPAPEIQHKGSCASYSDLYSLGMVFIACFNGGHSVIEASHSSNNYFKLAGQVTIRPSPMISLPLCSNNRLLSNPRTNTLIILTSIWHYASLLDMSLPSSL